MAEQPWLHPTVPLEDRVTGLLEDLSDDELVSVTLGEFEPFVSRGVPAPHYVDSGTGLRGVDGATAFPAGIALGASFDEELATAYGAAVGREARRSGFTVVLGPTLDLARDPVGGRIPEAFGEDPHLTAVLGAAHVRGLQGEHVVAQLKHYVAYTGEKRRTGHGPETDRGDAVDVSISPALLHDVYLRPFEAAVRAGAWSLMGSYNRLGGEYVCERADVLDIPRRLWGWQGFYCPDFLHAVRDPARALAAGLDLGALGGDGGRTRGLVEATEPRLIRSMVANVARALIGSGLVDDPLPETSEPSSADHRELAREVAIAGSVLLRNEGVLPLSPDVGSIAVIGPSGTDAFFVGGGAASVTLSPDRLITPLAGLRARAGDVGVLVAQGSLGDTPLPPVPSSAFTLPDGSGRGVLVEFSDGDRIWTEIRPEVSHQLSPTSPTTPWPRRWLTRLTSDVSGPHRLSITCGGTVTATVDGQLVLAGSREAAQFISGPRYPLQATVQLEAGVPAELEIHFDHGPAIAIPPIGLAPGIELGWDPPGSRIDEAVRAAEQTDVAVVFVQMASGEGMDRDGLDLPGDQDELVRRVAAANPHTVVVLNTPGAVLMPWANDVAAILQVWFPGETYGDALAAMVFGDAEPGGRLPLTFPHRREDLPGATAPGEVPTHLDLDADAGIGHRHRTIREGRALFPFGHGLGYSDTEVSGTTVPLAEGLAVELEVVNTGTRPTTHVVQVYVELENVESPELVAVRRLRVSPAVTTRTQIIIPHDELARWDETVQRRVPVRGSHRIRVARDSSDRGLEFEITI